MKTKKVNDSLDMTEFGWYVHPNDEFCAYIEFDKVTCIKLQYKSYRYYTVMCYGSGDSYVICSEERVNKKLAVEEFNRIIEANEERLKNKDNIELV